MKVSKPPEIQEILLKLVMEKMGEMFLKIEQHAQNIENSPQDLEKPTFTPFPNLMSVQEAKQVEQLYQECYDLLTSHKATDDKGRYLYWDKIRHKYGKEAEKIWAATKINRLAGKKKIQLTQEHEFTFCVPDTMQSLLHFIDKKCGNHIMLAEGKIAETGRQILMQEEAITSAQLEGAATTRKAAKQLLSSQRRKPQNKYERMIVNNHNLMQKTIALKNQPLDVDMILSLHKTATENAIDNEAISGAFRTTDDIHIADYDGNPVYQPPRFEEVPALMEALCRFANEEHDGTGNPLFIHPVVKAVMLHFFTGYIHPFGDGNGRTARALFYWFMLKKDYNLFEYISISRLLNQAPSKYARSYLHTEADDLDMTYFIYYQLDTIRRAIEDLQKYVAREAEKLKNFTAEIARFADNHHLNLNRRQIEILQLAVEDRGRIFTVKDTALQFGIAENTARADLKRLLDLGLLGQFKSGNAIDFIAPNDLKDRLI